MSKTDQPGFLNKMATRVFMAINIVLLGVIFWRVPAVYTAWVETDDRDGPMADTGQDGPRLRVRNPSNHLPLKGMDAFEGDDKDACLRMEGFLLDMDYELAKADLNSRVPLQDALTAVKAGQCSIQTPEVAQAITALNKARVAVGLDRLPPGGG